MAPEAELVDLGDVWRLLGRLGLIDGPFNHISLSRWPNSGEPTLIMNRTCHGVPTPTSEVFRALPLRNYSKREAIKEGLNPDGLRLHADLHLARGRGGCAVHLHAPYSIAVGATKDGLLPLSQTAIEFTEHLRLLDYEGLARRGISDKALLGLAKESGEALLRNHGLLVMADTPAEALYAAYYLERACRLQVLTLSQGLALHFPSQTVIESTARDLRADRREAALATFNALLAWAGEV